MEGGDRSLDVDDAKEGVPPDAEVEMFLIFNLDTRLYEQHVQVMLRDVVRKVAKVQVRFVVQLVR